MPRRRFKPEKFKIVLGDKRVAKCERVIHQDYSNARISAGVVSSLPPEDCYFMFERPHEEPTIFLLRRDEMIAAAWVITGALWTDAMQILNGDEGVLTLGNAVTYRKRGKK